MANGLRINISEDDFKAKPIGEQNWMLYQGITKIDQHGCSLVSTMHKESVWKKLTVVGAGVGGGVGFAVMIGRLFKCW